MTKTNRSEPHIVIIGGGFSGLYAAQKLGNKPVKVTLVDKRNFHLFQPLLYQVATGGLSPGDISSPLRSVLNKYKNISVLQAEATDIDAKSQKVILKDGELTFDYLIVATGSGHHYFGNPEWENAAPGLKTIEDALEMRSRVLSAFERAEREPNTEKRKTLLTFVVTGGGPTGVELTGALAELARYSLKSDFRNIDPAEAKIYLAEGADRILHTFPEKLSHKAEQTLTKLGVTVITGTLLSEVDGENLTLKSKDKTTELKAATVLWAAGVKATNLGSKLADSLNMKVDKGGRVPVNSDCSVGKMGNVFVVGDLADFKTEDGNSLPGVAPVAMQQGSYAALAILTKIEGVEVKPFKYRDKGSLAVIGRNAAVAEISAFQFYGISAWVLWIFVHIGYLIGFDNKILVMFQWAWNYFTRKRGARLITGHFETK